MPKRKLTQQQKRRIASKRVSQAKQRTTATDIDDSSLGPPQEGLVISHFGTLVDIEPATQASDQPPIESIKTVRCHLRANLDAIVTGDRVIWRAYSNEGVVESVIPRTSELHRPDGYGKLKLIAANITQACIVIAPEPEAFSNLIDRYLVITYHLNLHPILVVNKADLPISDSFQRIIDLYQSLDTTVIFTSTKSPDTYLNPEATVSENTNTMTLSECERSGGLESLQKQLNNHISIFVGQSGVGKSSLIQALLPDEDIKIGKLSEQARKGKHTTTHAKFYHFSQGGACIDSPGIREFGLWHLSPVEVAAGFKEFQPFITECRFRDCSHNNEPGCALIAAVDDGKIHRQRFDSYHQIVSTLGDVDVRQP